MDHNNKGDEKCEEEEGYGEEDVSSSTRLSSLAMEETCIVEFAILTLIIQRRALPMM